MTVQRGGLEASEHKTMAKERETPMQCNPAIYEF